MENIEKLQPRAFTRFCMSIGAVPSSYLASLSFEEQLLWFCSYLEKNVIPAVNNNAEAVTELQNLYTQLKDYVDNYFDNLDVQEEINNKLDEMAESGELADIIAQYLNSKAILGFNTIADLKVADNLADGSLVETYGYYSIGDEGKAKYKVRQVLNTDTIDDAIIIGLSDPTLVAELVLPNIVYPEIFGCYGNNTNDDTQRFQKALDYGITYGVEFVANKSYVISDTLTIEEDSMYKKVKINGTITFTPETSNSKLFSINGAYGEYYFNNLVSSDNDGIAIYCFGNDYSVFAHNDIKIGSITDFDIGILFDAKANNYSTGLQYNKVHEGFINATTCIKLNAGTGSGWVNQNYFENIKLNGYDGIYAENLDEDGSLQNNIFTNIGFETVTHYMVYEKNGMTNKYRGLRVEESYQAIFYFDKPFYSEIETTYGVIISRITKVNGGNLIIRGRIYTSDTDPRNISTDYAIIKEDDTIYINSNELKNRNVEFVYYDENVNMANTTSKNFPKDTMIKFSNYNGGNNTITICGAMRWSGIFYLRVAAMVGGDLKVYDGSTQIGKTITEIGMYTFIRNKENSWEVGKQTLMQ